MAAPFAARPVLAGPQHVLAPLKVWVLIEDPVTFHDVAGVNLAGAEALQHVGAVVHELHHVSHQIRPVVDPQPVGSSILRVKINESVIIMLFR